MPTYSNLPPGCSASDIEDVFGDTDDVEYCDDCGLPLLECSCGDEDEEFEDEDEL